MARPHLRSIRPAGWSALLILLWLAGCSGPASVSTPNDFDLRRAQADAWAAQGLHLDAARLYESLIPAAPANQRFTIAVAAANGYAAAGASADGLRVLPALPGNATAEQRLGWAPAAARLYLAAGRPADALTALAQLPAQRPAQVQREALLLTARAQFALGQVVAGIQTMVARAGLLGTTPDILEHQRLLWNLLRNAGGAVLQAAAAPPADREIAGWIALGVIGIQSFAEPARAPAEIANWQTRFPGHSATPALLAEILASYQNMMAYPRMVAVLLPLSSTSVVERQAALAVRDGLLAAYFAQASVVGSEPPDVVRIYDTSAGGTIQEIYRRAVAEGANFIVGPLLRPAVDGIAAIAGNVPTLALNRLTSTTAVPPPQFYQFALSPEEEAEQAARIAMQLHGGRAVAIVSSDEWGLRMLNAFQRELEAAGGRLIAPPSIHNPTLQNFVSVIESLLQVNQSTARRNQLAADLGITQANLNFEARRRQDIDFIFLATAPQQARLIRTQLRYFLAGDVPVYAASDVFNPAGGADNELNDVIIADAPWMLSTDPATVALRRQIESLWPERGAQYGRFYAMGHDAYRLIPLLQGASDGGGPTPSLQGLTGMLSVDAAGRVLRSLSWGQFRNGRPVPINLVIAGTPPSPATLQLAIAP